MLVGRHATIARVMKPKSDTSKSSPRRVYNSGILVAVVTGAVEYTSEEFALLVERESDDIELKTD
jgi:hypothetical protein